MSIIAVVSIRIEESLRQQKSFFDAQISSYENSKMNI
jgi:hypothetical protein